MLNEILYVLYLAFFLLILFVEHRDLYCSQIWSKKCDGEGMPYQGTQPQQDDSVETLVHRLTRAAGSENRSIKWRRALILSSIVVAVILLVIIPLTGDETFTLPRFDLYITCVLASFTILYFSFNYYSYHIFTKGRNNAKEAGKELLNKISL